MLRITECPWRGSIITSVLTIVFSSSCMMGSAEDLNLSSGCDESGAFSGSGDRSIGGSSSLELEIAFAIEQGTSPALIYAISRPRGDTGRFAYICVVNHRYSGGIDDVSSQFRHRLHVADGTGEVELSSGTGNSRFKIVHSTVVKRRKNAEPDEDESVAICKTPVELSHGRIFFVDLSSDSPVVNQVDYPLPNARGGSQECDKKVRKVLHDMKESIAAGRTEKRLLKLRLPNRDQNRNQLEISKEEDEEEIDWLPDPNGKGTQKATEQSTGDKNDSRK
jgi:hypothetical protein